MLLLEERKLKMMTGPGATALVTGYAPSCRVSASPLGMVNENSVTQ